MKKIILLAVVALGTMASFAQSQSPELGIRFGGGYANINALDGILPLGDVNRLHADLSFGNRFFSIDGLYEWQFDIGQNFVVYPGVGAGFYNWSGYNDRGYRHNGYTSIAVVGVIGIEYVIEAIPISVGLDFRPTIGLTNSAGYGNGWGLMARYRF